MAFFGSSDVPLLQAIGYQLDHEVWDGFRFWDLVMPLFLFMTGVSMPFSFSSAQRSGSYRQLARKIFRRFIILFLLGVVVQGNLLGLDPERLRLYNNTLQAIGAGYLCAAPILLKCSVRWQVGSCLLLLLVYSIPMAWAGDYTAAGNFAGKVDQFLLGRFRGDPSYSWIWSTLTFTVTVLLGALAGQLMKSGARDKRQVVFRLLATAAFLLVAAALWSCWQPVNKRIWSASMTLLSGGYCFLLMGLCYYWVDYKGHTRGLNWLKFYGMNSITAYLLGEVVNFRSVAHSVCYGLEQYAGAYYPALLTAANYLLIFFILRWMYRRQLFMKI